MSSLRDYLTVHLMADGYDGLCSDGCGCETGYLVPCGFDPQDCETGHKEACTGMDCAEFAHCGMEYDGWCMMPGVRP